MVSIFRRAESRQLDRGFSLVEAVRRSLLDRFLYHIAVLDSEGRISAVNESWNRLNGDGLQAKLTGRVGESYLDICREAAEKGANEAETMFIGVRRVLVGELPHLVVDFPSVSSSERRWYRLTATPIMSEGGGAVISLADVTQLKQAEERKGAPGALPTSVGLLSSLVQQLAAVLEAKIAFVSELLDPEEGRVRIIAMSVSGETGDTFEYTLQGTPCEYVFEKSLVCYPSGVQDLFPDDAWLRDVEAESYLAVPLFDSGQQVIGHIGVLDVAEMKEIISTELLLRVYATRVGAELERLDLGRALEKSERTARALLNAPMDSALLVEPDGTISDLNEVAAVRLGVTVEDALGKNVFDLFPPDVAATRRAAMEEVMTSRKPLRVEDERAGMHFETSAYPVLDPQGDVERIAVFATNVTARKIAEEALVQSERRIRQVAEHISEMVWLSDPEDGKLLYVSPAYERIWGRSCQSLYENLQSWLEAVHPDDLERVQAAVRNYEQEFDLDYRIIRPDGALRWVWARSFPVREMPDGRSRRAGVATDITERKLAEDALREGAERYRALYEDNPSMYFTVDAEGTVLSVNQFGAEQLGYTADELVGQSVLKVFYEADKEAVQKQLSICVQNSTEVADWEFRKVRKDGSILWVKEAARAVRRPDGGTIVLIVCEDITEHKRAEEALRQSAQRNATLIEAIPDMMFTLDRRGVYVDFVPADGLEPYAPPGQFLGRTVFDVLPASLAQNMMRGVELALDSGRPERLEYELELDDERRQYEARILKSKEDEALAIVRDVTAQKRQEREEELRRVRDELEGRVEKEMLGKNPYGLTFREFTVLHLAANGAADKEIADQLGISTFTVSKHVANILGKMAASSRTEACVRALREGLLT